MGIKERLTVFRWDHLSHYQWASWFALAAALAALAVLLGPLRGLAGVAASLGIAAAAGQATALAAGLLGEASDASANEEAGRQVREVGRGDVLASALGGVPVSAPLALAWAMLSFLP
jgi:hypothetical protein